MRLFAAFLLMCSLGNAQAQTAYESVNESTTILLERLVEVQPLYEEDPEKFFTAVQDALSPYIDFEGFAKRVMAKHHQTATEEQRAAFQLKFEKALIRTYATALLEFDNQRIVVVKPTTPQKRLDRATILIEVYSGSGTLYPVHYQLGLGEDGRWLLRNVIIDGINLGLQFRSQFNAYMQKYKKDIDLVIENWEVEVNDAS
ncbi:MAG: ABC transporter substrate-binding protein [Pseudomonadales bacterium]|nr:ABC transporter substrate-binding protein [Pseudomonadales bacterium]MBO6566011.1 ABC transporter substrate-binding protein [Pseudomonadales bacterium]MBO6594235.1 ABC transporter substrate-binding protein [Pseudomonadales bacterium]MBO6656302.1 ABC transporter substrate-binding protein [Pseudomonadales bacterium]MBO6700734.1 ABC transporter substrate-binding protein [Pseudomonadales bacterium]